MPDIRHWIGAFAFSTLVMLSVAIWAQRGAGGEPGADATAAVPSTQEAAAADARNRRVSDGYKETVVLANSFSEWSLLAFGGTLLLLLKSEYRRVAGRLRYLYVLFPLAWISLAVSLYAGLRLQRGYVALLLRRPSTEATDQALMVLNSSLDVQIDAFYWALSFLGLWLIIFLGADIFGKTS